jgi:colanic acid/amylovoran biosynthesis glycosyltransferase
VAKKGLSLLLEAWSGALSSHQLTLVTETERDLPEGVTCIGYQPPSRIPEIIDQHNLMVMPCQIAPDGDMDGIPIVFMEALSRGRPVLSTTVSGIPELVSPEVGWLLEKPTMKQIQELLAELSRDLNRLEKIGNNGPEHLRNSGFCRQKQIVNLIDWILNVTV